MSLSGKLHISNGLNFSLGVLLLVLAVAMSGPLFAETPIYKQDMDSLSMTRSESDKIESAYDFMQIDNLMVSARRHQEAGQHQEAVGLFTQAWQVSRIANGLYHESQITILEELIPSQIVLEDWDSVDAHYANLQLLYTRLYTMDDPRLEAGLSAVASWHVTATEKNLGDNRTQHMRKARKILKLRLEIAELSLADHDPKIEFLNESIRQCELILNSLSNNSGLRLQAFQQFNRYEAVVAGN